MTLKATKHFKLNKTIKRLMGSQPNKELRDHYKNIMIQADLYAVEQAKELEKKKRKDKQD